MPRKLTFHLRDPKFSIYHRAGLAGLVTSLSTLTSETVRHSISELILTIEYDVSDFAALDLLLRHAFPLTPEGQALGRGLFAHMGFSDTLLQIPSLRKLVEKTETEVDGIIYSWLKIAGFRHQSAARSFTGPKEEFKRGSFRVRAWMLPGATGGAYLETVESLLPLLFAPLAYTWFDVYSTTSKRGGVALVVPQIESLENFVAYSPNTPKEWHVSSVAEAALNYSLQSNLLCEAKLFGPVAWDKHQRHVREKADVTNLSVLGTWGEIYGFTENRVGELPDGRKIVIPSTVREMTSRNLLDRKPLYMDMVRYHDQAKFEGKACQKLCKIILGA